MDSYFAIHKWLRRKYGSADACENRCAKGPFHWALRRGKIHAKNIKHYKKLCVKCHHKYDKIHKTGVEHFNFGKKASLETRRKMSDAQRGMKKTKEHRRKISKALTGRKFSDSHRLHISIARKNYGETPKR